MQLGEDPLPNDLPPNCSTIREVPDNQEVYLSRTGLTSIIFEIVERAAPPTHPCTNDAEALQYHYKDITAAGYGREEQGAGGDERREETRTTSSNSAIIDHMYFAQAPWTVPNESDPLIRSSPNLPAYTLFATQHPLQRPVSYQPGDKPSPDFTAILLTMIRLEVQSTDLLVSINVPHVPGEYKPGTVDLAASRYGPLCEAALEHRDRILKTVKIEDWSLFIQDED